MPSQTRTLLARAIKAAAAANAIPATVIRKGEITEVNVDGTVSATIGGDDMPVADVQTVSHYAPAVGDKVRVEVTDGEPTVIGTVGPAVGLGDGLQVSPMITTSETRAATTYGNLATVGPSVTVTVGDSGILLVGIACLIHPTSDNDGGAVSFTLSGAVNTLAADDTRRISFIGNVVDAAAEFGKVIPVLGLNPGSTTVTMVYKDLLDTGNDVAYANRVLWALPL